MKFKVFIVSVFFLCSLFPVISLAQNKVVVIPFFDEKVCNGTLNGTRWCDRGDGTVLDMRTNLLWLQKADWGGLKPWQNPSTDCSSPNYECFDDAHHRASSLKDGAPGAELSDGSQHGHWRLPTAMELYYLTHGYEAVSPDNMRAFAGVQNCYWSSSPLTHTPHEAYVVCINGNTTTLIKEANDPVWPVRSKW